MLKASVAILLVGFTYPSEKYDAAPKRFMGSNALAECMMEAAAWLNAAERQMPSQSKAYARCEIER